MTDELETHEDWRTPAARARDIAQAKALSEQGRNSPVSIKRLVVRGAMTITLHPDQEAWLEARVTSGDFASVEAAAH
jgi:hypothetical protein